MCANRFDIEEEQLAFIREYKTEYEIDIQQEDTTKHILQEIIEISEGEGEEEEEEEEEEEKEKTPLQHHTKRKRDNYEAEEETSDEAGGSAEEEPLLPKQSNTQRASGRARIPSIRLQGYTT
jgi:hypothetical protein